MNKEKEQNTLTQKCKSCGGEMVFNPKTQKLECVQCKSAIEIEKKSATEKAFENLLNKAPEWESETVVYHCENCGAKEVISKTDIAVKCDYCGATNIIKTEDLPGLRPDSIALFKLTKEEATIKARKWLSKRFFAPSWYKKNVVTKGINGIYFPAFTFDVNTTSNYDAIEVTTHTRTKMVEGKQLVETYQTRRPVWGTVHRSFDDVVIPAADSISQHSFEKLTPFETNTSNKYEQEYLSGFMASHYTKDAMQSWSDAKLEINKQIKAEINSRHSSVLENLTIATNYTDTTYKYILLPIYVGHSEYEGRKYQLCVNGQTGKVYGKTPQSIWKVLLTVAGALALVGGAIALAFLL